MNKDLEFMNKAITEAKKAYTKNEVPVGAIIVYKNKIIAKAYNLKESKKSVSAHAEILAINQASEYLNTWRLDGCTMYVTLEPCIMCASAIGQSRISKLVISALDTKEGAIISNDHILEKSYYQSPLVTSGLLESDSKQLLKDFFKKIRKNDK